MKSIYRLFVIMLAATALFSCGKSSVKPSAGKGKALTLDAVETQKVVSDNAFTFKLFQNVTASDATGDNIFISPLSVSFAMAMTSNGAAGQTKEAIDIAMDFGGFSQDQLNSYYNNLLTNLPELDPNTTLNIANSIWYKQGFNVLPDFIKANTNYYNAKVAALDFSAASAPTTINAWVNTQTKGKISSIVDQIPSDAVMYLINAMYFKSIWNNKFDASQTKAGNFYVSSNSTVSAQFMNGTVNINSYSDSEASIMELPYANSRYSMVIIEPQSGKLIRDVAAGLDSLQWASWMSGLQPTSATISLPKFTFSYNIKLNNALTDLGMGLAFGDDADFSGISTQGLKISEVMHKAYVAVDESGTEAAAVTSVGFTTTVALQNPQYVINRPFIFAIREMSTGIVLFTGMVNNPLLKGE